MDENAAWALGGVVIGGLISIFGNLIIQRRQHNHEKNMRSQENKSEDMVKSILEELLNHKSYTDRSLSALKQRIGGYSDDEIRQFLHEVGAVKTSRKNDSQEWWYLKSREKERIANKTMSKNK
ncbi:MAG: hypothetical protein ACKVOA_09930 [Methylophilaceae bacterium]